MSKSFEDEYASAVRSSNLRSQPETTRSHCDLVGAAGLAAKKAPLAMALTRLFVGDNHAAEHLVRLMAGMLVSKAWYFDRTLLRRGAAVEIARAVLAWHRHGTCQPCSGRGLMKVPDAPMLSTKRCMACHGTGRVPFDRQFASENVDLAQWLLAEIEREQAAAGQAAMRALAPTLHW